MKPENACQCERCRGACVHKPGWFMPEEIEPLAQALGITEQELFDKHLQVDYWDGDENTDWEDVFVLSPAVVTGQPGEMFDRDPRGQCRWYQNGLCAIHDLGKPFECAAWRHDEQQTPGDNRHERVAMAWNKPEHQEKIERLLGRKPVASGSWGLLDSLFSF